MEVFTCKDLTVDLTNSGEVKRVVHGVSFNLEKGKIYDLSGPSGSGKSTVLLSCALMEPVVSGVFELSGRPSNEFTPEEWRSHVCLVPQNVQLIKGTIRDNLLLPWSFAIRKGEAGPSDDEMIALLRKSKLEDISLDRDADQLSGGQAARVALARAFLTKPDVLLLDEVDAALDDATSMAVSEMTKLQAEAGTAILRIRHRGPDGFADSTFHMEEGRLVS